MPFQSPIDRKILFCKSSSSDIANYDRVLQFSIAFIVYTIPSLIQDKFLLLEYYSSIYNNNGFQTTGFVLTFSGQKHEH